jgi:hypothetical protein
VRFQAIGSVEKLHLTTSGVVTKNDHVMAKVPAAGNRGTIRRPAAAGRRGAGFRDPQACGRCLHARQLCGRQVPGSVIRVDHALECIAAIERHFGIERRRLRDNQRKKRSHQCRGLISLPACAGRLYLPHGGACAADNMVEWSPSTVWGSHAE